MKQHQDSTRHLPREFQMPSIHSKFPTKELNVEYEGCVGVHDHWVKHRHEFPEYGSARDYLKGVIEFCSATSTQRFYYRRKGRPGIGYFHRGTGTFAATSVNGETIFTYFRPGPGRIDSVVRAWRMPENETGQRTMPPGVTPRHATPIRKP